MKTKILLSIFTISMIIFASAQKPVMTLTFTADNIGQHVPLNSILIENLTRGGDTTLFSPDTILVLNYILSIGDNEASDDNTFIISKNYPNPMYGKTTIGLYLHKDTNVRIMLTDVTGRKMIYKEYGLEHGSHFFTFYPGDESLYFFYVVTDQHSQTIKMINSPTAVASSEKCKLEYSGSQAGFGGYKTGSNLNNFNVSIWGKIPRL
jgi:hypothetical protein